jgi:hypothetical protein
MITVIGREIASTSRSGHHVLTIIPSLWNSTAFISYSILEYRTIQGGTYQTSKTIEYWHANLFSQRKLRHHETLTLVVKALNNETYMKILDMAYSPITRR